MKKYKNAKIRKAYEYYFREHPILFERYKELF